MFGIGMTELMVILVIGLLVIGPKKLPELARSLGRGLAEFRRASTEMRREFLGEDNPMTHSSFSLVGEVYRKQGRLEESESMHVTGLERARESLGSDHWYTGIMLRRYGACLLDMSRYDEAEATLLEAYEALKDEPGRGALRTKPVFDLMVRLYDATDRPQEAEVWRARQAGE